MTTMLEIRGSRAVRGLALPLLAGAVLGLSACGGDEATTTTNAANGTAQGGSDRAGDGQAGGGPGLGGRGAAVREELRACLEERGVTLPPRPTGGQRGGTRTDGAPPAGPDGGPLRGDAGGGLPGGGPARGRGPGGGTGGTSAAEREKLRAAMKACGVTTPEGRRGPGGGRPDVDDAAYRRSIEAYTACVRKNGFDLPAPDFSGKGPVFDPDEVDQTDATFEKASAACRSTLRRSRPDDGAARPGDAGAGAGTRTATDGATT